MKYSEIIEHALEPKEFWDDFSDYRDSFRNLYHYGICHPICDACREKIERIKKQIKIRKAKSMRKNNQCEEKTS